MVLACRLGRAFLGLRAFGLLDSGLQDFGSGLFRVEALGDCRV